ncbi:MAG TPA: energy-coupling factor transporter transmembrane component T [Candidatus Limnocylindrales bacterium]|nr:energy-coupling factor transporter transmembrane component T [Candidatus Limnocylindrales bacterium]
MRLLTPIVPDAAAPLARANPVAKLAAALIILVALFASLDGVTAAAMLLGLVALLPASGLPVRTLFGRAWLVGVTAIAIGVFNVLFAAVQLGPTVVELGPLRIGAETLSNGGGLVLRLLAIALAGLLATATSDPVEVADALVQHLRMSPRFAIGVLAALRLLPLLAQEWQTLGLARRARGVDAGRSPIAAVRLFAGKLLSLLVSVIRRGSRMALAMEARGFGALPCRSVARPQHMRAADWAWIGAAVALASAAVGISLALGTWRPLLG